MLKLHQTETGIYYLHDYIPSKKFRYHSESENEISRKIWAYKNGDAEAINIFTNELMHAVSALANCMRSNKIGLVAVPPSKRNKYSAIRDSIEIMDGWHDQGLSKTVFGCHKTIYDYSTLLTRISDISTAHEGVRASYEEQKDSIACSRDNLSKYWTAFIILDDVTTRGTSMDVCKDILLEHGAKEQYIVRLAIAKTI